jgi:hypothetical protein
MLPATRDRNSVPAGDPAETIGINGQTIQPWSQIALISCGIILMTGVLARRPS